MRQLVSIVTDNSVAYYLDPGDGEGVSQVAQIINPGLGVNDVIDFGSVVTQVLSLNGNGRRRARGDRSVGPPRQPELEPETRAQPEPEPEPARTKKGTPRKRAAAQTRRDWGLRMDDVLAYVMDHPGAITHEIAADLLGTTEHGALQTINNHLHRLRQAGEVRYGERAVDPGQIKGRGNRRALRTVTATLPAPRPQEPEQGQLDTADP